MLRGRFLKELLKLLFPKNTPFGDSRRWGDLSADFSMKLPASGRLDRLRQKESRGKWPLVVAADTGLTFGDGVMPAMIGARIDGGQAGCTQLVRRVQVCIHVTSARFDSRMGEVLGWAPRCREREVSSRTHGTGC
jgi:hypothetical protein